MLTEQPRQPQESKGVVKGQVLRLLSLGQRSPFGFGVVITDLTTLNVGAVLTEQQVDQITRFRIFTQRFRPVSFLLED